MDVFPRFTHLSFDGFTKGWMDGCLRNFRMDGWLDWMDTLLCVCIGLDGYCLSIRKDQRWDGLEIRVEHRRALSWHLDGWVGGMDILLDWSRYEGTLCWLRNPNIIFGFLTCNYFLSCAQCSFFPNERSSSPRDYRV